MNKPVRDLRSLPSRAKSMLQNHGLLTIEQLAGKLALDQGEIFSGRILGLSGKQRAKLKTELGALLGKVPAAVQYLPLTAGLLGLATSDADVKEARTMTSSAGRRFRAGDLPSEVNHAWDLPEIRDQGNRGTCVAFSMIANREFILSRSKHLSEQHLYNRCKAIDGHDGPGTYLETAVQVLNDSGVCLDSTWPYDPRQIDDNEGHDPPPDGIDEEAVNYRILRYSPIEKCDIESMMRYLACGEDGSPNLITVGVAVFRNAWANPYTVRTGVLYMPTEEEMWVGAHAITLVGYAVNDRLPGGGAFMFRNSWGTDKWSIDGHPDGIYPPGYGLMPFAYLSEYGTSCIALQEGISSSTPTEFKENSRISATSLWVAVLFALIGVLILGIGRNSDRFQPAPTGGVSKAERIGKGVSVSWSEYGFSPVESDAHHEVSSAPTDVSVDSMLQRIRTKLEMTEDLLSQTGMESNWQTLRKYR